MTAFYNEHDPYCAQWLRNLIDAGEIAPGVVDERDIRDIAPEELERFTQVHFFAGLGGWSLVCRRAGWPDDRPIWTGSCPCQPFSTSGGRGGFADERHVWPYWHWLIDQLRPAAILGEQVASKDGLGWLDLVSGDMEASGYAIGPFDLSSAGFGGAHIRQRLYFVALADAGEHGDRQHAGKLHRDEAQHEVGTAHGNHAPVAGGSAGRLAYSAAARSPAGLSEPSQWQGGGGEVDDDARRRLAGPDARRPGDERLGRSGAIVLADADLDGRESRRLSAGQGGQGSTALVEQWPGEVDRPHPPMLGRDRADWLFCRDGRWRPVEPGSFPLAYEAPARVGRLRAYGNAIDAAVGQAFVEAVMEEIEERNRQHA